MSINIWLGRNFSCRPNLLNKTYSFYTLKHLLWNFVADNGESKYNFLEFIGEISVTNFIDFTKSVGLPQCILQIDLWMFPVYFFIYSLNSAITTKINFLIPSSIRCRDVTWSLDKGYCHCFLGLNISIFLHNKNEIFVRHCLMNMVSKVCYAPLVK